MNIVAFGCSCTYGQALGNNELNWNPSPLAWPGKLAELYNCTVENLGFCGASNKRILHSMLNYNYKPDDVVFVCWTHADRWAVIQKDDIINLGMWHVDEKFRYEADGSVNTSFKMSKAFFENVHDWNDMTLEYMRNFMLARYFLNDKGIKNFHTSTGIGIEEHVENTTTHYDVSTNQTVIWPNKWFDPKKYLMPDSNFLEDMMKYPLADDNVHPGPLAHAELAEKFYNYSKDKL